MKVGSCPVCGSKLEMFEKTWCPKCDKPVAETLPTYNLSQVLEYCEKKSGYEGFFDTTWNYFMSIGDIGSNGGAFIFKGVKRTAADEISMYVNYMIDEFDMLDKKVVFTASW